MGDVLFYGILRPDLYRKVERDDDIFRDEILGIVQLYLAYLQIIIRFPDMH